MATLTAGEAAAPPFEPAAFIPSNEEAVDRVVPADLSDPGYLEEIARWEAPLRQVGALTLRNGWGVPRPPRAPYFARR